ncbi:hypothetical protein F4604DRAFT_1298711 [Suillus subluteus]|nr:hypothetical protein F4604DRAFT_1298711 [Suillus subluteus]
MSALPVASYQELEFGISSNSIAAFFVVPNEHELDAPVSNTYFYICCASIPSILSPFACICQGIVYLLVPLVHFLHIFAWVIFVVLSFSPPFSCIHAYRDHNHFVYCTTYNELHICPTQFSRDFGPLVLDAMGATTTNIETFPSTSLLLFLQLLDPL